MLTKFGKFCRKVRIDNGELLFDMAKKLGVSSAFLSKVENGKAKPPAGWESVILQEYKLTDDEKEELIFCIQDARTKKVINLADLTDDDQDMMLAFARKLNDMPSDQKERFKKLLNY